MKISVKSCAKVNLTLEITGKRKDGYHLINSVFQSINLCDTIEIEVLPSENTEILCFSDYEIKENICKTAAEKFLAAIGKTAKVEIKLKKQIPISAGLGGGSSNAAAVLLSLNKFFGFVLKTEKLLEIAESLGADVPFFLNGGTQHVYSIGEKTEKINSDLNYFLVLIKNNHKPSTAYMYKQLDLLGEFCAQNKTENLLNAITDSNYEMFCKNVSNDFEKVLDLTEIKTDLINEGANTACLSGSGPTVFGVFENEQTALSAYNKLKSKYENVYLAAPTTTAIVFE